MATGALIFLSFLSILSNYCTAGRLASYSSLGRIAMDTSARWNSWHKLSAPSTSSRPRQMALPKAYSCLIMCWGTWNGHQMQLLLRGWSKVHHSLFFLCVSSKLPNVLYWMGHACVMASTISLACHRHSISQMTTLFTQVGSREWSK